MDNRRIQIEALLGALFILISSLLLLFVGFRENRALASAEVEQKAEKIEVGAVLFTTNCARCHGDNGQGLIGPPLNDAHFFTARLNEVGWEGGLEDYVISTVAGGRIVSSRPDRWPGEGFGYAMPPWSQEYGGPLRPDQIEDIAIYVLNWEEEATAGIVIDVGSEPPPISDDPLARGKNVYVSQGCGACHTIDGVSAGVVGPNFNQIGAISATRIDGYSAEEYILESIINPNAFIAPECPNGPCVENLMTQTFGDTIAEPQLADLIEYLLSLK